MARIPMHLRALLPGSAIIAFFISLVSIGCADFGTGIPPLPNTGGGDDNDSSTVFFAAQVLPIFAANCGGNLCHRPCVPSNGGGMCLESYSTLTAAGVVIPGDAENSLIVQYLEGRRIPRMPYGRLPLADSLILRIRTWIDEGAVDN